jgi:hypothetical protein
MQRTLAVLPCLFLFSLFGCAADAAPLTADVIVESAGAGSPVPADTACTLRMQPAWRSGVNCQVLLRCHLPGGDEDLFGGRRIGGYSVCETEDHAFVSATDDENVRDGDPALRVDLGTRTLSWRGPHAEETAELRITGELRPMEAWDPLEPWED